MELTDFIRKSLEIVACAFLDIEGAFDNTSHEAFRDALWSAEVLAERHQYPTYKKGADPG